MSFHKRNSVGSLENVYKHPLKRDVDKYFTLGVDYHLFNSTILERSTNSSCMADFAKLTVYTCNRFIEKAITLDAF
jgi:hypothetical protein